MNSISHRGWEIRALANEREASTCATAMANSEPWLTLQISDKILLRALSDATREVFVITRDERITGSLILNLNGPLQGYIQNVFVIPEFRNKGIGGRLIAFAEERIFRAHANVFLCVSSFNEKAQRWYYRLGYEKIGELNNYLVAGESELLLRKTRGPISVYGTRA